MTPFRTGCANELEEKGEKNKVGLGVPSIPNLVTSNEFSLIKANGMPFLGMTEQKEWAVLDSKGPYHADKGQD